MTLSPAPTLDWTRPGICVSSHTVPWTQPNLLAFLRRAVGQPRFFWEADQAGVSFAAFGITAAITGAGPGRFVQVQEQARELFERSVVSIAAGVPPEAAAPRLVGGFSFRDESLPDVWARFSQAYFVLPQYVLTRVAGQTFLTVHTVHAEEDRWAAQEALWNLPAPLDMSVFEAAPEVLPARELVSENDWRRLVESATQGISRGRLEKIVLARAREVPAISNPLSALARLSGRYPDCYRFLVEPASGHAFFGATPELLVSVSGETVKTMALAGSIRRGETFEEDVALGERLLASDKERREHQLVVNTIVENLAPVVQDVHVGETGLLRLSNIQHIHTPIAARRRPEMGLLELVAALHPTPAVGGLPARPGLAFIANAEPVNRGWYASPVGWFDASGCGTFVVALRSAVTDGTRTRIYAGAGIVAGSDPAREWRETELKFRPMMEAVGCRIG